MRHSWGHYREPDRDGALYHCWRCGARLRVRPGTGLSQSIQEQIDGTCHGEDHFARAFPGEERPT